MSAHADTHHHGPPIANQSSRIDATVLGMFLFIASEAMLFGAFFTAYFFVRVVNPDAQPWPLPPFHLPVFVAGVNTAVLLTSSFTMHWALQSIKRGNRDRAAGGARADALHGARVPAHADARVRADRLQPVRRRLRDDLLRPHGPARRARLRRALTCSAIATVRAFRGHFTPEHHHGVELPGIYWHFVDVMWIVVYSTIYLI